MVDGMLTVKEYAEQRNKSVQAVYKQMKGKATAAALEGHVHTRKFNNKKVQCLDEEAVKVLDAASTQSVQIVMQTDDKLRIAELEQQIEVLKAANVQLMQDKTDLQQMLLQEKDKVIALQDRNATLQLEAAKATPAEPDQPKVSFWERVFGRKK